jgi:hypothetical protein
MTHYVCAELSSSGSCLRFVEQFSIFDLSVSDAQTIAAAIAALWVVAWVFKILRRVI